MKKLYSVQYLRACAALLVLFAHAFSYQIGADAPVIVTAGRLGVILFFVISGYIMTRWFGVLDTPGQSIDQRVKMPRWMDYFEACGGRIEIEDADISTIERLTLANDLVIVATGKGEICRLFPRNAERSTYT
mgnify:CR=1 FL=1